MYEIASYLTFIGIGVYLSWLYKLLSTVEPFCFYLPGGIGRYYKVHKNVETKFDDIVGSDPIKDELKAHLKFFKAKNLTKGFFFQGPSGTGKTMMAKAIAGANKMPFVEIFTDDFQNAHIPTVINAVIKKYAPCTIFIDECDTIVNTFNSTLLRKLDGIESLKNVFLILATTKEIDSAVHRSGRIDKVINFQLPTYDDRREMFLRMGQELDRASELARQTANFTFADISIIPREIEFNQMANNMEDYDKSINYVIDKIRFGRHTSEIKCNNHARERIAYHEIGHLLLSCLLKDTQKPHKITIIPEGKLGGHILLDLEDMIYNTRSMLLKRITICLASSIFETYYLGEYSTLCEHDFTMIEELFKIMDKNQMLGYKFLYSLSEDRHNMINKITPTLENFILEIIQKHKPIIDKLHSQLLERDSLDEKEIYEIVGDDFYDSVELPKL